MSNRARNSTFVSPADGELPRLQPLSRLPDIEAPDIDAGRLFGKTPVKTHERRDPLTEAQAFMLKYAGLTVILLVLAVGLTLRLEWHYTAGIILFAGMATGAYWLLAFTESLFTGPGVERHRLTQGARVLLAQIDADKAVRMAQVQVQVDQISLQREHNDHMIERYRKRAQLEARSEPQAHSNRLHGYTPRTFELDDLEPPRFARQPHADPVRASLLAFVVDLYEQGDSGEWLRMDADGYIANSVPVPWSQRGGHTATERRAMLDVIRSAHLAGFDENRRAWRVNVRLYPDADSALDGLSMVATRG